MCFGTYIMIAVLKKQFTPKSQFIISWSAIYLSLSSIVVGVFGVFFYISSEEICALQNV